MSAHTPATSAELPCHQCGYDLRAHPPDGKCPECGALVAESRRMMAIPRRPIWRDRDRRWRRRILAGAWLLVFLPLWNVLLAFGWASSIPVPNVIDFRGTLRTLDETLVRYLYQPVVFCMGVVLLFSSERGRQRNRLDWTRRWGVLCSYVVLLLSAASFFVIAALVLSGIAALCMSMPLKYQPPATRLFVELGTGYLRYGPFPAQSSTVVLVAFSSIAMLLACVPLFEALCSAGSKRIAGILLIPIALFSLIYLAQVGQYFLVHSVTAYVGSVETYFRPGELVGYIAYSQAVAYRPRGSLSIFAEEALKWCIVVGIAIRLSVAQVGTWRARKKPGA